MFLRRYSSQRLPPNQVELSSSAQSLGLENANPAIAALNRSSAGTDNSPCLKHYRKTISGPLHFHKQCRLPGSGHSR